METLRERNHAATEQSLIELKEEVKIQNFERKYVNYKKLYY